MPIKNGWTNRVRQDSETIQELRAKVLYKDNLIDAMKTALAAREKMIEDTINELQAEKKANLNWCEFAHHACMELKDWREIAESRGGN